MLTTPGVFVKSKVSRYAVPHKAAARRQANREGERLGGTSIPEPDVGSLIYTAAYHGNVRHLKKLLARCTAGTDFLSWRHPHGGATAIYVACEFGHLDVVELLLKAGAKVDAARDDGATPLYKACQDGKLDIVKMLLANGASVDQVDGNQMTALWVRHQGRTDLAKILLEAKADPLRKVQEWSPVMLAERLAREEGKSELLEIIQKYLPESEIKARDAAEALSPAERSARLLYHAATHGDEKTVRKLLEEKDKNEADVNCAPGEGGTSPLYAVCSMGDLGMVQLLLDAQADPNLPRRQNGETPLYVASEMGRPDVAQLLLEHGADLDGCTAGGTSALMVACHKGHGSVARLLLDRGAKTGEAKKGRGTALISAATMGHTDCVRMLVDEGNEDDLGVSFQSLNALQWAERGRSEAHRVRAASGGRHRGSERGWAGGAREGVGSGAGEADGDAEA